MTSFQASKSHFSSKVQKTISSVSSTASAATERLKYSLDGHERKQLKAILEEVSILKTLNTRVTNSNGWMDVVGATTEASKNIRQFRGLMSTLESDLHEIITSA